MTETEASAAAMVALSYGSGDPEARTDLEPTWSQSPAGSSIELLY